MARKKTDPVVEGPAPTPQESAARAAAAGNLPTPRILPIRDNILVLPDADPDRTESGLFIPKAAVEMKKFVGTVIAVGEGHMTDERLYETTPGPSPFEPYSVALRVKRGDRVIYSKYSGSFVMHENIEYVLIREADVQAVVLPKP